MLDVSSPTEIRFLGAFDAQAQSNSIPHNQRSGSGLSLCPITTKDWWYSISVAHRPVPAYAFRHDNEPKWQSYKRCLGVYPTCHLETSWYPIWEGLFVFEKVDDHYLVTPSGFEAPEVAVTQASMFSPSSAMDGDDLESIHLFDLQGRHCGRNMDQFNAPSFLTTCLVACASCSVNRAGGRELTERIFQNPG